MIACFRGCGRDGRIEAYQLETFTTSERSMPQRIWMASLAARFLSGPGARAGQGYIAVEHYLFLRQIFQLLPAGAEMILEPTHINPWTCATSPIGKQIGHCTYLA